MKYLCQEYPDVIEESVENVPSLEQSFIRRLKFKSKQVQFSCVDTAELLLGRCGLSQRGYKSLRKILLDNNVKIPSYSDVSKYCNEADVGEISKIHKAGDSCKCMGVETNFHDTIQKIVSCKKLFSEFSFYTLHKQKKIFQFLKEKDGNLYGNLDDTKRTFFIRDTGDNFRACSRYPTEQTSYSVLNLRKLVNCPYGQFISTLWRGSESRDMIESHVSCHYNDVTLAVKNGVDLIIDGVIEHFNIVCFFVADLCFIKDVLGVCTCTSTFGCYHCKVPRNKWSMQKKVTGEDRTVAEMCKKGVVAHSVLGFNPNKESALFKKS